MNTALSRLQRAPWLVAIWLALPALVCASLLVAVLSETCTNTVFAQTRFPGGEYKAILFERSCSGTVAWTTHASVLPVESDLPDAPGNALVSFERHGSLTETPGRQLDVQVQWVSPTTVHLAYSSAAPIQHSASSVEKVTVKHVRTER
jgi:hypothetical protein